MDLLSCQYLRNQVCTATTSHADKFFLHKVFLNDIDCSIVTTSFTRSHIGNASSTIVFSLMPMAIVNDFTDFKINIVHIFTGHFDINIRNAYMRNGLNPPM